MAVQASKSGFEKWQDGLNNAVEADTWNAWDCVIRQSVNEYNQHLSSTTGYMPLDWKVIKAMVWTETGAGSAEWQIKPMQIGVPGDPGLSALLSHKEGGDLILPPAWKGRLTVASARTIPAHNIQAGVGYLLMRMANFDFRSVPASDARVYEVTAKSGDSLAKIATDHGTTIEVLKKLNPSIKVLQLGQALKYQKASVRRVITGWRQLTMNTIALRYNSMRRDPTYAMKLDYALNLVRQGKTAVCEH